MSRLVAYLFPGQGSQARGMGKLLHENFASARAVFEEADDVLGFSISNLCFEGSDEELALTANTQPAIVTVSVAAMRVLEAETDVRPSVALGHSLGEFAALVAAGALTFADAVRLVRIRGEAMQAAVPAGVGAMAAIIGLPSDAVERLCIEASELGDEVAPANENGGGQVVVAGHAEAVKRLIALAKGQKARAVPLRVSAPFHCALMRPAAERLRAALVDVSVGAMRVPVIANVDAQANADSSRVKDLLVAQVTSRVRWEGCVRTAVQDGAQVAVELGHGSVLAGLTKRIDSTLRVLPASSPADFDVIKDGPK